MREKRRGERSKTALPPLTYRAEEILIAKNRNFSPLVLSFVYEPENIALRDLGTLFGTFIVTDQHEDSGYIVNCLAAAAKKEYFINSRRSVEESFESTLHKINLTLGKLVRDGHINWMGKLHGAIIAIQNRNAYFSITGDATILLLRNNALSAISEGLSDPEAALHPLKTFTEISSGSLLTEDKIILSTPELLELLPHALLEREASKLPLERFAQLLKTALVNERPAAATILINFSETIPESAKDALRIAEKVESPEENALHPPLVENAWSSQAFHKNEAAAPAPIQDERDARQDPPAIASNDTGKEHIDNRTGHIYIQADSSIRQAGTESALDETLIILKEHCLLFSLRMKKQGAKHASLFWQWISHSFSDGVRLIIRGSGRTAHLLTRNLQRLFQKILLIGKNIFSRSASVRNISFPKKISEKDPSIRYSSPVRKPFSLFLSKLKFSGISFSLPRPSLPQKPFILLSRGSFLLKEKIPNGILFWKESSRKKKIIISSVIGSVLLFGSSIILLRSPSEAIPIETTIENTPSEPISQAFPPADEPSAKEVSGKDVFSAADPSESPVTPIILRNKLFAVTPHSVINTENNAVLSLPEGAASIRLASAMDDLNAIFIYGRDKKMYTYYPNVRSLAENTLPIPSDFTITDMDTYLTYLYAFDAKQGRILRFPRAEGGFGAPIEWLKESLTFDENAKMSIGENILVGAKNTLSSFERGRGKTLSLASTKTPINIRNISIAEDGSFAILDTAEKRIARFSGDGRLIGQYFSEQLSDATGLAASADGNSAFIAIKEKILSFNLQ